MEQGIGGACVCIVKHQLPESSRSVKRRLPAGGNSSCCHTTAWVSKYRVFLLDYLGTHFPPLASCFLLFTMSFLAEHALLFFSLSLYYSLFLAVLETFDFAFAFFCHYSLSVSLNFEPRDLTVIYSSRCACSANTR